MALQLQGNGGNVVEVDGTTFRALRVVSKPYDHGSLGHYRTSVVLAMAISQAANSRLFEIRNTGTNLLVLTRCWVAAVVGGTVTTPYVGQIGMRRATSFTAVDTTNTVTPTSSPKRTTMGAYPGGAAVRHMTVAGAAAGMTGGTITSDANYLALMPFFATTGAAGSPTSMREMVDDMNNTHPLVLAQNEGFTVENVIVGSATANTISVAIDVSWAEVTSF